jgi:hypothetical protein
MAVFAKRLAAEHDRGHTGADDGCGPAGRRHNVYGNNSQISLSAGRRCLESRLSLRSVPTQG